MKKIILFLALMSSLMSSAETLINDVYYKLYPGKKTATVMSGNKKYIGRVIIPASVMYQGVKYSVTSIGKEAFKECTRLVSVKIPNGVKTIESGAFERSSLTSITIPPSMTEIGFAAFYECTKLTAVHIKDIAAWCKIYFTGPVSNPLYYAHHLYMNGKEIKELVIPDNVTKIRRDAFNGCSGLISVYIPKSVTSIGDDAFWNCNSLTYITVPKICIDSHESYRHSGSVIYPVKISPFSGCPEDAEIHIIE